MKQFFTTLLGKSVHLLTVACLLFATNGATAQVTATEDFDTETGASSFSESGINFTHTFNLANIAGYGYGGSAKFLELVQPSTSSTTTATISINNSLNPGGSFKINSFAGYVSSSATGSGAFNGAVTVSGIPVGGSSKVSATINIASASGTLPTGQSKDANGIVNGLNFTGTALDGLYFTTLTFSINDADGSGPGLGTRYLELDHINFSTPAIVTTQLSINDVSLTEGNSGTRLFNFTVTRSSNTTDATVNYATANGTAIAGSDYVATSGTLSFPAGGPLTQTISVTVNGDVTIEGNETFFVNLSNPTGGTIAVTQGTGTILEDDETVETFEDETVNARSFSQSGYNFSSTGALMISRGNNVGTGSGISSALDTRVGDGGSAGNVGSFSITNPGTSFFIIGIDVWTSNDDGLTGTTSPVTVTFTGTKADGTGTVSYAATIAAISGYNFQTISFAGTSLANVQLISMSVTLGAGANYISLDNFKYGTAALNATQVSINDVSVLEGTGGGTTTAIFTVSRTNNTSSFTVNLASSDGTATAGSDYTAYPSTSLSFIAGGALSQTVTVTVLHDAVLEPNETFNMTLSGATNGTVYLKQTGVGTILDDEGLIETFEDETDNATNFSENTITFSASSRLKVHISQNSGSGSSAGYLTAGTSSTGGSVGKISITSPNKAFKLLQLDAWTGNGNPTVNFASGDVTFTGTLYGGGTVTTTKTITPTSNTGTGWQKNITFTGTPLDNVLLTDLEFSVGGILTTIDIDNINYAVVNTSPYTEVTDASNNAITNGNAASTSNNTDFGTVCTSASVTKTFTIKNTGSTSLNLSGSPLAVLGGANAGQFSITAQPAATVAVDGSTTFTVSYSPIAAGTHSATITLTSNDAVNSPYIINIKGTANDASLTIGTQPAASTTSCTGKSVSFTATGSGGGTLNYQWYMGATALTDGASGTGSVYTGTTTNTLTIANISASDNATNYYATIKNSCAVVTSTNASLTAVSPPVVTGTAVTQPTCTVPTGTIVVNATGSGTLEYSNNGISWQTTNTFSELTPGNYLISVRIQGLSDCAVIYSNNPVVINTVPVVPTVTALDITQPTCAVPSGTIVVNATGDGTLEYSNDGGAGWQPSNTFSELNVGNYNIAVRLQGNTTCSTNYSGNPAVIQAVPTLPDVTAPTVVQPTCAVVTGTIAVNATGESALEYSSDGGITWQLSNSFSGLAPNSYDISVRLQNSPTCVSSYSGNPIVINAVPLAPVVNAPTVTQPTCSVLTGTIVVNATGGTLEYSKDGGANWQLSNTFSGLTVGTYSIAARLQNNTTCISNYSGNPVTLNAATGCIAPPIFTLCPGTKTVNSDAGVCTATLSQATLLSYVTATGTPAPTLTVKVGNRTVTSSYAFPKGNTTVTVTASNGTLPNAICTFTVSVQDNQPPVINTVTTPIVLQWSSKSKYQTVKASQLVASVTDNCSRISTNSVVITKVTSDEPDDAPGNADGSTTQDIKIASNCTSVDLRSERLQGGNGRVYTIYLKATDNNGNIGTATAIAIVPANQNGTTATDNGPSYTVNSSCNTINTITQSKTAASSSATVIQPEEFVTVQNYPNPFSSFTTIRYQLPTEAQVSLVVYNSTGQAIANLVSGRMPAGKHSVRFDVSGRAAGIYLYRLQTMDGDGKIVEVNGKMAIAK